MRIGQVRLISTRDGESPAGKVRKESLLRSCPHMDRKEVIDLRKNRPRQDPGIRIRLKECSERAMVMVIGVDQRDDRPRVGDNHPRPPVRVGLLAWSGLFSSPMPFSNFSARSATSPRPLWPIPGLKAFLRRPCLRANSDTASRTSAAGDRLISRPIA